MPSEALPPGFRGVDHLKRIREEAQALIAGVFEAAAIR